MAQGPCPQNVSRSLFLGTILGTHLGTILGTHLVLYWVPTWELYWVPNWYHTGYPLCTTLGTRWVRYWVPTRYHTGYPTIQGSPSAAQRLPRQRHVRSLSPRYALRGVPSGPRAHPFQLGAKPLSVNGPKTASVVTGPGFGPHRKSHRVQLPAAPKFTPRFRT